MSNKKIDKIISELLDGRYFKYRTGNGLNVLVYEMPEKSSVSAQLSIGFGSADTKIYRYGTPDVLPDGTAHFLEHKMFENNGEDIFSLFADIGASANAYTTFNRTTFVFRSGNDEYKNALKILLNTISEPRFSNEGVEKEKSIISDEIRMYLDDPSWRASFGLFKNLYHNISINSDIAGSEKSIKKIDADILLDCFNSFYQPENMVLAVCGCVQHEEVFLIAENYFCTRNADMKLSIRSSDEPASIIRKRSKTDMNVSMPLFCFGYKERCLDKFESMKTELLMDIVLDLIAGESTDLFKNLYEMNLINDSFGSGFYSGNEYVCTFFEGETPYPYKVRDQIKNRIQKIKTNGFRKELFEERARASVGGYISLFDSPGSVVGSMVSCHFKKADLYDIIQFVNRMDISSANDLLRSCFLDESSSISIVNPINTGA